MSLLAPTQFSIRLVHPIHLPNGIEKSFGEGTSSRWQPAKIHEKYRDEMLRETLKFLFPVKGGGAHYFRVREDILSSWFRSKVAVVQDGSKEQKARRRMARDPLSEERRPPSLALSLEYKYGIELFVLHDHVAVFSICFTAPDRPDAAPLPLREVRGLQYYLSDMRYRAPVFRIPHPDLDEFGAPGELSYARELTLDDPLEDRLGKAGQPFSLAELCDLLLKDLTGNDFTRSRFLVHSVLRFDRTLNFIDPVARNEYLQELVAFSQIEEPNHSPAVPDSLGVPNDALNANHLAGYSYLGAAHFVSDQWAGGGASSYDDARVESVQRKYFGAFLTTLAERMIAHHFLEEAIDSRLSPSKVGSLWERFTHFEAAAQLLDISDREAVNRCYRLAQRAQRIPDILASLHRVFRDAQATEQARQDAAILAHQAEQADNQLKMLEQQNQLIQQQKDMVEAQEEAKRHLGVIEIFIATVYTAELVHILGTSADFEHLYTFAGVSLLSLLALATIMQHHRVDPKAPPRRTLLRVCWIAVILWLVGGFALKIAPLFHAPETIPPTLLAPRPPRPPER